MLSSDCEQPTRSLRAENWPREDWKALLGKAPYGVVSANKGKLP